MNNAVRSATLADVPLLINMMEQFYSESDFVLDHRLASASFSALLANSSLGAIWIVEQGCKAVGYTVLTLCFSMEHGGLVGFIDDLFVLPSHRRQGVGRLAIEALLAECKKRRVHAIHVEVGEDNAAAQTLYRSWGLGARDDHRQLLTKTLKSE